MGIENLDIVFVSNALANGGAARVICTLASEFVVRGKRVGIAIYNRFDGEYEVPAAVAKEYGPQGSGTKVKFARIAWLRAIAKRNPAATIVAFEYFVNMQTLIACAGLRNRVVISERNDPSRIGDSKRWLREILYRRADMLVCQTDDAASYFSGKVRKCVILNPLPEGLPSPYDGMRRRAVVTFCRLEPQKNLSMLIRAFAVFGESHPDYTLEIYGDGSERDSLKELVERLGIAERVKIMHSCSDVHELVCDAAMFVLPSDYEGLSNSMLEAMAMGMPVICTDCPCGGARMVIRDGKNGMLVPVGDETALAACMAHLADDAEFAKTLGRNAANLRDRLSVKSIADQWSEVIW